MKPSKPVKHSSEMYTAAQYNKGMMGRCVGGANRSDIERNDALQMMYHRRNCMYRNTGLMYPYDNPQVHSQLPWVEIP